MKTPFPVRSCAINSRILSGPPVSVSDINFRLTCLSFPIIFYISRCALDDNNNITRFLSLPCTSPRPRRDFCRSSVHNILSCVYNTDSKLLLKNTHTHTHVCDLYMLYTCIRVSRLIFVSSANVFLHQSPRDTERKRFGDIKYNMEFFVDERCSIPLFCRRPRQPCSMCRGV